jgi:hypothetical protein
VNANRYLCGRRPRQGSRQLAGRLSEAIPPVVQPTNERHPGRDASTVHFMRFPLSIRPLGGIRIRRAVFRFATLRPLPGSRVRNPSDPGVSLRSTARLNGCHPFRMKNDANNPARQMGQFSSRIAGCTGATWVALTSCRRQCCVATRGPILIVHWPSQRPPAYPLVNMGDRRAPLRVSVASDNPWRNLLSLRDTDVCRTSVSPQASKQPQSANAEVCEPLPANPGAHAAGFCACEFRTSWRGKQSSGYDTITRHNNRSSR